MSEKAWPPTGFLGRRPRDLFEDVLRDYQPICGVDATVARSLVKSTELFERLTAQWYTALDRGDTQAAMSVYADPYYFIDIFQCFTMYSREYLRRLLKSTLYGEFSGLRSFVDLGCGLAYSTCALKELLPFARATAVNLPDTPQWQFCRVMAERHSFELTGSVADIQGPCEFVFASEFYEHLRDPFAHVTEVVTHLRPTYMVIANSFNTRAMGHFTEYLWGDKVVPQKAASRAFNAHVRSLGYEPVKCGMWNNKPLVWRQVG